jgi:hypothetical protein
VAQHLGDDLGVDVLHYQKENTPISRSGVQLGIGVVGGMFLVPDTPAVAALPDTPPIGVSQLPTGPSRLCALKIL